MNNEIIGVLILSVFLLFMLLIDIVSSKNTALGKILQNPWIGGFLMTNILCLILIGAIVYNIYILNKSIEIKHIEIFIFLIVHLFLIKNLPKYYYKKNFIEYEKDKYAFLLKHKKLISYDFNRALKDHGIEDNIENNQ